MIIGLGTGRSGTTSLSKQLNIGHELAYSTNSMTPVDVEHRYRLFKDKGGNVCFTNIHIAEALYKKDKDIRFIHVTRDREETINSLREYIRIWHEDRKRESPWDRYFPQFNFKSDQGLQDYYDWYIKKVLELRFEVEVWPLEELEVHVNRLKDDKTYQRLDKTK